MGLANFAAGASARSANIAALQAVGGTSGTRDLYMRIRMKVDGLQLGTNGDDYGIAQVDDGTDANAKIYQRLISGPTGSFGFRFDVKGQSNIQTPTWTPGSYPALANGRFIVGIMWIQQSGFVMGYAFYDDTGTGTLVDGLAPGTSVFEATASKNSPIQIVAGNGEVVVNYAQGGASIAQIYDSIYITDVAPTLDQVPTSGILAAYLFDDTPAALASNSGFVSASSGPIIVVTGTATAIAGGAEATQTFTPTLVTGTPSSPTCQVAGTVQLNPVTQDQYGATGTLTPTVRTYSYTVTSGGTMISVNSSGLVSGLAQGTGVVQVADTASGGGSAADWNVTVTVTAAAGTTYDWSSSNSGVVTSGTGLATEAVTEAGAGAATLTITRHGTSATCTVSVIATVPGGGGAGQLNMPSGLTPGINTGSMTTPPSQVSNGTWQQAGAPIASTWNNFTGAFSGGGLINPAAISSAPGSGIRLTYPALAGMAGNNPATWGTGIVQPSGSPVGVGYFRMNVRFDGPFSFVGQTGVQLSLGLKMVELRCGQHGENHYIDASPSGPTTAYMQVALQSPYLNLPNNDLTGWSGYPTEIPNANLQVANAAYVQMEALLGQETTPGVSADAYVKYWVTSTLGTAGTLAFDSTISGTWQPVGSFNMLNSASTKGWQFLLFNQTYGGAPAGDGPVRVMTLDTDQILVATS